MEESSEQIDPRLTDAELLALLLGPGWEKEPQFHASALELWRPRFDAATRKALIWACSNKLLSGGPGPLFAAGWTMALDAIHKLAVQAGVDPWDEEPPCSS